MSSTGAAYTLASSPGKRLSSSALDCPLANLCRMNALVRPAGVHCQTTASNRRPSLGTVDLQATSRCESGLFGTLDRVRPELQDVVANSASQSPVAGLRSYLSGNRETNSETTRPGPYGRYAGTDDLPLPTSSAQDVAVGAEARVPDEQHGLRRSSLSCSRIR